MSGDLRNFARRKFEFIEAAGSDPELPSSLFRLLLCVLDRLPEGSDTTALGDDYLREECPGYRRDGSLRKARAALHRLGYWRFTPGSGRRATTYTLIWERVSRLVAERKARAKIRQERRDERDEAFRALAKVRRGELLPTPGEIDPPSLSNPERSETATLDISSRGGIKSASPQMAQLRAGKIDPPFNSSASIEEANEKEIPPAHTRRRMCERSICGIQFDPEELGSALLIIGNGDQHQGRELLALLDIEFIKRLADRLDDAGAANSIAEISAAKAAATRIARHQILRRTQA